MTSKKSENWGGKRQNAGRRKSENTKKTIVIRIDEKLLPIIKSLKERQKAGEEIESLLAVTDNQELKNELEKLKKTNLDLVLQKDKEHLEAVKLKGQVLSVKNIIKKQKAEIKAINHKIYDCQALKKDGTRCTRPAKLKTDWHGVEINTCLQHSKSK